MKVRIQCFLLAKGRFFATGSGTAISAPVQLLSLLDFFCAPECHYGSQIGRVLGRKMKDAGSIPGSRFFFLLIFAYAPYVQQVVRDRPCKRNGVMASVLDLHLEAAGSFLTHFFQCFSFFPFFKCRLYYYLVVI